MKIPRHILLAGLLLVFPVSHLRSDSYRQPGLSFSLFTGIGGADTLFGEDIYTGAGEVNTGGMIGIGGELTYKNVSFSLGGGRILYNQAREDSVPGVFGRGVSFGIKAYSPANDSGDQAFGGISLVHSSMKDCDFSYDPDDPDDGKVMISRSAVTAGYRHNFPCNIYFSSYIGAEHAHSAILTCRETDEKGRIKYVTKDLVYKGNSFFPCFGINVGYQFSLMR